MEDKNGKRIEVNQLVNVLGLNRVKYFYIERVEKYFVSGKRVNKDFSFHYRDKVKNSSHYIYECDVVFEVIDPMPPAFLESLRTLHFLVDNVLEDFGRILNNQYKTMLRAVIFQNGSYGIIQNRMYCDMSDIDLSYEVCNLYEDLSYEELINKWNIKKTNSGAVWSK